jgi:hypothetical protein
MLEDYFPSNISVLYAVRGSDQPATSAAGEGKKSAKEGSDTRATMLCVQQQEPAV